MNIHQAPNRKHAMRRTFILYVEMIVDIAKKKMKLYIIEFTRYYNCDNANFSQCIYTIIHVVCIRNILHYQVHVYY